ncbi:MFS transporter [Candidatus Bandiella euplotis]|uniref:MFS transporter n=1 Tax=Candidatus Bandiella euplotis TaxID=1664265 RepID=UPI002B25666E|nr:MFS transporter [Candidatus Bandiella woodruffii]
MALSLFYAYQLIERIIPNVVMQNIMDKYHVGAGEIGRFAGIYYVGYVAAHIPLGILLDHFNAKKVIPICILLAVAGFAPLAYLDNFAVASYGRLLIGFGSAGAVIGSFKMFRICFSEEKFPRMLGWMVTFGLIGAVFGSGPLANLVAYLGWVETLHYVVISGLVLAVFSYLVIPNTSSEKGFSLIAIKDDFKYLFSNKTVLVISFLGGLMIGPLEGFADAWSSPYLRIVYQLSNEEAGYISSFVYIGMALGLIVMGYIFEKTKAYYTLIITSSVLMTICFGIVLAGIINDIFILKTVFLVIGFFCAYQIYIVAKSIALSLEKYATFISAISNMTMMLLGYFFHTGIGKMLHHLWDGVSVSETGSPIYSADSFSKTFAIIPVGLVIATVGFILLAYLEKRKASQTLQIPTREEPYAEDFCP